MRSPEHQMALITSDCANRSLFHISHQLLTEAEVHTPRLCSSAGALPPQPARASVG